LTAIFGHGKVHAESHSSREIPATLLSMMRIREDNHDISLGHVRMLAALFWAL
jgi:hypothetical protein